MNLNKLSIAELKLAGKRVLIRVDFNVPMKDGKVTNTRASTPPCRPSSTRSTRAPPSC